MNRYGKRLVMLFLILIALTMCLVSCINDDVPQDVTIDDITISTSDCEGGITASDISRVKIVISMLDDTTTIDNLTLAMINDEDLPKLDSPGEQTIRFNYKEKEYSITIIIQEPKSEYAVVFKDTGDTLINDCIVRKGESFIELVPERFGYIFAGWYYSNNYSQRYNGTILSNTILYARWDTAQIANRSSKVSLIDNLSDTYSNNLRQDQRKYLDREKKSQYIMPSTGNVNILVLPINFKDTTYGYSRSFLEECFFGKGRASNDISLAEFYDNSSYGKLNITGDVSDIITLDNVRSYYNSDNDLNIISKASLMLFEAMIKTPHIDWNKYDNDKNGTIEGVYLIVQGSGLQTNYNENQFFHAYNFPVLDSINKMTNVGQAILMPIDYLDKTVQNSYGTSVVIHETGHYLGLSDYYDYDVNVGADGGLGRFDMMDNNSFDHNPVSKLLLGWINPEFLSYGNYERDLNASIYNADSSAIFISATGAENIFTEFYVVSYYVKEGNNLVRGASGLASSVTANRMLVIYHVDLSLNTQNRQISFLNDNTSSHNKFIEILTYDGNLLGDRESLGNSDFMLTTGHKFNSKKTIGYSMYTMPIDVEIRIKSLEDTIIKIDIAIAKDNAHLEYKGVLNNGKYLIRFNKRIKVTNKAKILIDGKEYEGTIKVMYAIQDRKLVTYIVLEGYLGGKELDFGNAVQDYSGNTVGGTYE